MKKGIQLSVLFLWLAMVGACAHDEHPKIRVDFSALFVPLSSVVVYDTSGSIIEELYAPQLFTELAQGEYFLDFYDESGESVIDEGGNLRAVPVINATETLHRTERVTFSEKTLLPISVELEDQVVQSAITGFSSIESAKARVVWEAARAMVGPTLASSTQNSWPETATYSSYPYVAEDPGAWAALRAAYSSWGITGWWINCRHDADWYNNYTPCVLQYGGDNVWQYGYQGNRSRGGQCKGFVNLVLYRSGVYHGSNWSFKTLPSDASAMMANQPWATYATISPGDVLRRPGGHALIVVRKISNGQVVVVDSNWVGGDGAEAIGTHVLGFSGSGNSNLGNYRNLTCVYNESC